MVFKVMIWTTARRRRKKTINLDNHSTGGGPTRRIIVSCRPVYKDKQPEQIPNIKAIFFKSNAAFPSSSSVERLFSVAGRIFTPLRGCFSDKNFQRMLLLKVKK
jgi:hypothetical protein